MNLPLKPIHSKSVKYSVYDLNTEEERCYEATSDEDKKNLVFILTPRGDIEMPFEDVPLLIKALQDYIK